MPQNILKYYELCAHPQELIILEKEREKEKEKEKCKK